MPLAGDFNANLAGTEGLERAKDILAELAAAGLDEMLEDFLLLQCPWDRDGSTWSMVRLGREVRSQTYYILGTDHRLYRNISVRNPRHNSYRYFILGCLLGVTLREFSQYFGRHMCPPPSDPRSPQ